MLHRIEQLLSQAEQLLFSRRWDLAETVLRQVLSLEPTHDGAMAGLSACVLNQGRVDEAETNAREALALNPENSLAHDIFSRALARMGNVPGAIEAVEEALRLQPHVAAHYARAASIAWDQFEHEEVLRFTAHGLALEPAQIECLAYRALAFAYLLRRWEAKRTIDQLLRDNPDEPFALWAAGVCAVLGGREEAAVELFRSSVERAPMSALFHQSLAVALKGRGLLVEATQHIREAHRLDPTSEYAAKIVGTMERRRPSAGKAFYPPGSSRPRISRS